MTLNCITLEKEGLPTVVLAAEYFKEEIQRLAEGKGVPHLSRHIFPGRFETLPKEQLRAEVIKVADTIAEMLTSAPVGQRA